MQNTGIVIEYQNRLSDHIHAVRAYDARQPMAKGDKVVAVLLAIFGVWAVSTVGVRWWTIIWFAVAPVEWFNLLSIRPLQVFLQFRMNPKFKETYRMEFDESGIHFVTPTIDSHIEWAFYNRIIETERVFILVYGKSMYSVVPKWAFQGKDLMEAFRGLLQSHIR